MNITPEQARELLDGVNNTPWRAVKSDWGVHPTGIVRDSEDETIGAAEAGHVDPEFTHRQTDLIAAAPDLAQTIAGMEWEYGIQQPRPEPHAEGELYTSWGYRLFVAKAACAGLTDSGVECYIVRRLVGPVEEVTE